MTKLSQTEKLLECAAADPTPAFFRTPDGRTFAYVDGRTLNVARPLLLGIPGSAAHAYAGRMSMKGGTG